MVLDTNQQVRAIAPTCMVHLVIFLTVNYAGGSIRSLPKVGNGESVPLTKPNIFTNDRLPTLNESISEGHNNRTSGIDEEGVAVKNVDDSLRATNNSTRDVQHNYGATVQESNGILSSTHTNTSPGIIQADSAGDQEDTTAFIYNNKTFQASISRDLSRTEQEAATQSTAEDHHSTKDPLHVEVESLEVSLLGGDEDIIHMVHDTTFLSEQEAATQLPREEQETTEAPLHEEGETLIVSLHGGDEDITHMVQDTTFSTDAAGDNYLLEVTTATLLTRDYTSTDVSISGDGESAAASSPGDEEAGAAPGDEAGAASVLPDDHLVLDITINMTGVTLTVDGRQVFRALNNTAIWGWGPDRLHAGLHLVTLHQVTGRVMVAQSYMTWQPSLDQDFLRELDDIQNGRLLVILGAPDFTSFLGEAAILVLEEMGALYIDRLAYKDTWCLLVHKDGRVMLEALTTSLPHHNLTELDVSPLTLHVSVPRTAERVCGWYGVAGMKERAAFCDTYDGYGDFCSCHDPPWSPFPHKPMEYEMEEVIPVAIVTARRLPHVLRQVGQVWASPGGTNTPITIFVDGHNPEAQALAALLHLPVVQHHNPASKGSTDRISSHVKFVLTKVFELYPEADKAIILEDDLELSPDFIPAYNSNAFSHTALDPRRLYRVRGVPAYGWMLRRNVAKEMINNWVPTDLRVDWDLWVRYNVMGERDILVPEIPRTKHRGGGGVHVTGIEQEQYYNQRPLNGLLNVTLDVHGAELNTYLKLHTSNIRTAHVVHFSKHPCMVLPIPRHQVNESFVVYVDQPYELSTAGAYYVTARCLGLDDHYFLDNLKMMYTTSFFGNQLYVIGCPYSLFCMTKEASNIYRVTPEDNDYARNHPFRKIPITEHLALRVPPISLLDEISLTNLVHYYIK